MITIKKYSNRRLYDTSASSYVNLGQIADMIRDGERIEVVDAKTGEELTQSVLLQILIEEQGAGGLLPTGLLHRIIRTTTDNPLQKLAMGQLAAGLQMLDQQLEAFDVSGAGSGRSRSRSGQQARQAAPEPEPQERHDEDLEPAPERPAPPPRKKKPAKAMSSADSELDALRARLAALEDRLGS